ncbi:MAG: hypothetical protein H0T84_06150, partial [Tatlockia sp.]|nr:hypothetical protein [Tatlockia sp.]
MGFIKKADENEVIGKTDYQLFDKITADGYRINDIEVMESKREGFVKINSQFLRSTASQPG